MDADVPLRWLRRILVVLIAIPIIAVGVAGGVGYWNAYYVHRGFAPVRRVPHSGNGQNRVVDFYSTALGHESDYRVFLPPGYNPRHHRYPVYYLLHGSPGRPQVFIAIGDMGVRMDNLIALHQIRPMILVFPDGRIGGSTYSDSEWANTPAGAYESDLVDVVRDVDRRFATIPNRHSRAIAGFSAGAYGAVNVALHNLPVFGDVQSWSGYYRQSKVGVFARATPVGLAYNSPIDYVSVLGPELRRYPLKAYLFVGNGDRDSLQIAPMAARMAEEGVHVGWHIFRGGHDWELWNHHIEGMILRAANAMAAPGTHVFVPPPPTGRPASGTLSPTAPVARPARHHAHHGRPLLRSRRRHHRRVHRRARHRQRVRPRRPLVTAVPPAPPSVVVASAPAATTVRPHRGHVADVPASQVIAGLLVALFSAALINLGFLLQHRGLEQSDAEGGARMLGRALRSRTWLAGQALGWIGFVAQIAAVAIAPLSLVQAFAAGGLALSVPLSATVFGHRIARGQRLAVLLIAAGLAALPIATPVVHEHLIHDRLLLWAIVGFAVATVIATSGPGARQAVAAGIFYGVADAAIKAISVRWGAHGFDSLLSEWGAIAAVATFLGFLTFQTALRTGGAVASISLMNAFAALIALAAGLLAFGESLGRHPLVVLGHAVAIALVLVCVPSLAAAQEEIASGETRRREEERARQELMRLSARARERERAGAGSGTRGR